MHQPLSLLGPDETCSILNSLSESDLLRVRACCRQLRDAAMSLAMSQAWRRGSQAWRRGGSDPAQHIEAVVRRLDNTWSPVRAAAVAASQRLASPSLAQHAVAIAQLLEDSDGNVRLAAVAALSKPWRRGHFAQHVAAGVRRLDDTDSRVLFEGVAALKGLTPLDLAQHATASLRG